MTKLTTTTIALVLLALLVSAPVFAQDNPSAWPPEHRNLANNISWATVSTNVFFDSLHALKHPTTTKKHAVLCTLSRYAITSGASHLTKSLVHRERPDGSDNRSFYSGHTAWAFVSSGWKWEIGIPLAIGTGYGRAAANRHYWTDIAAGAGAGLAAQLVCKP